MNYLWTPTFPIEDQKETLALAPSHPRTVDKRDLEIETVSKPPSSHKRQRKSKNKNDSSPEDSSYGQLDGPKDKGRGRYACLNHRMKHKRCPPDCKERRPRPMQNPGDGSPAESSTVDQQQAPAIISVAKDNVNLQNHVLQLDTIMSQLPPPPTINTAVNPVAAPMGVNPLMTVSALPSLEAEWDTAEWEGLMEDQSRNQWPTEIESWDDMPSALQWESEGSDSSLDSSGASGSLFQDSYGGATDSPTRLKDLLPPILLTRDLIERWLSEPHFDQLVQGFYVRVRIGEYMDTSVYRIAKIDEVISRAFFAYNLGHQQTTKGVVLTIGSGKKTFSLLSVSNKPPTEGDIQQWEEECIKLRLDAPTDETVKQREDILRVMNLKYPPKVSSTFVSTSI